jgi:transcriptional regulator with XRE-family HTH domain
MARGHRRVKGFSSSRTAPVAKRAYVRLAARVRELRKAAVLTQEAFAAKAGIDSKYVQDIERGDANPTLAMLAVIAQALGLTLAEFLEGV